MSHAGKTYATGPDGSIEVPADLIELFKSHSCTDDWRQVHPPAPAPLPEVQDEPVTQVVAEAQVAAPPANEPVVEADTDEFSLMGRRELLNWLHDHNVPVKITLSREEFQDRCRATIAEQDAVRAKKEAAAEHFDSIFQHEFPSDKSD